MNKSQFYENSETHLTTNNISESPLNMKKNSIMNLISTNNNIIYKNEIQRISKSPLKVKSKKSRTRDKEYEKEEFLMSPKLKRGMSKSRSNRKLINA